MIIFINNCLNIVILHYKRSVNNCSFAMYRKINYVMERTIGPISNWQMRKKGILIKCIAAVLANRCSMQHMSGAG